MFPLLQIVRGYQWLSSFCNKRRLFGLVSSHDEQRKCSGKAPFCGLVRRNAAGDELWRESSAGRLCRRLERCSVERYSVGSKCIS